MTRFNNKKKAAIMLTGTLALTGAISAIPMPMFQNGMAAVVYAADGTEYSTVKGIATMGTGQAHIRRKEPRFITVMLIVPVNVQEMKIKIALSDDFIQKVLILIILLGRKQKSLKRGSMIMLEVFLMEKQQMKCMNYFLLKEWSPK